MKTYIFYKIYVLSKDDGAQWHPENSQYISTCFTSVTYYKSLGKDIGHDNAHKYFVYINYNK